MLSCSVVSDLATSWTVACQAPLSMGLPRQEYWSGLSFPPPGDLPDPGIEPSSPVSPALAGGLCHFTIGKPLVGRYLKGKLGLGIRLGTMNKGKSGIKDESMQQEELGEAG